MPTLHHPQRQRSAPNVTVPVMPTGAFHPHPTPTLVMIEWGGNPGQAMSGRTPDPRNGVPRGLTRGCQVDVKFRMGVKNAATPCTCTKGRSMILSGLILGWILLAALVALGLARLIKNNPHQPGIRIR